VAKGERGNDALDFILGKGLIEVNSTGEYMTWTNLKFNYIKQFIG
jgi:hypothetical protein